MNNKYILFDLDGTLINSYEGIVNAYRYACSRLSVDVRPDDLREIIGPSVVDSFKKYYGFDDTAAGEGVRLFREYYMQKGIFEMEPYQGVSDMLSTLYAHGRKLMIATGKPQFMAESIADRLGFAPCLCFISGISGENLPSDRELNHRVSKTDVIRYALMTNDIKDPENAVMVGDRAGDILAARNLGMKTVGVLYGFGSEKELTDAGADFLADSPASVTDYIKEI